MSKKIKFLLTLAMSFSVIFATTACEELFASIDSSSEENSSISESVVESAENDSSDDTAVDSSDDTTADSSDDTTVDSSDDTTVDSSDDTTADSSDDTTVDSSDDTTVDSSDDTTVDSSDDTTADSSDDTTVDSSDDTAVDSSAGEETDNEEGPKATILTADADMLATFNADGVAVYDLTTFQTTGESATLETAYVFSVTETLEEAKAGEYANWIADYYVSVDRDVEAGSIGLAGSYDAWAGGAWVAFYSPIDVAANEKIGLLESTGGDPWTYAEIVEFVGTFRCGAFDLNNACNGVKLTVELCLTNPDDNTDVIVISSTQYIFK